MPHACHAAKTITKASASLFAKEITVDEFNSAPRIVRAHVDRDQANNAMHAIQEYCSDSMTQFHSLEFSEKEGHAMLKCLGGYSEQKSKSILISLCHWRRVKMKKDPNGGMMFAVHSKKKEPRKFLC